MRSNGTGIHNGREPAEEQSVCRGGSSEKVGTERRVTTFRLERVGRVTKMEKITEIVGSFAKLNVRDGYVKGDVEDKLIGSPTKGKVKKLGPELIKERLQRGGR